MQNRIFQIEDSYTSAIQIPFIFALGTPATWDSPGVLASSTASYLRVPGFESRQGVFGPLFPLVKIFHSHPRYNLLVKKSTSVVSKKRKKLYLFRYLFL